MGDSTDGSSIAAQSAQGEILQQKTSGGFFRRIIEAISPADVGEVAEASSAETQSPQTHGMINLRRMRVEDVAVPKVDIAAIPVTTSRAELVDVFRESGFTRLPVFDGTLGSTAPAGALPCARCCDSFCLCRHRCRLACC
jgi:magnesium and cobalt transporter